MPLYDPEFGLISTVQKYSTKDGPGIRATVFFKGCPLGCLWCSNPELIRPVPDLLYTHQKCVQCGTCVRVCPRAALGQDENGWIRVDRSHCDACGECVDACPQGALELVGKLVSMTELAAELLKDRIFYQTSSGGVTFSGGEPLWQSGFVAQLAARIKKEGIHTALDTAGDVGWCRFEEVLDSIDLVLYDIKAIDRGLHRQLTGKDNDLILANARMLAQRGTPVHIRLMLVPGLNDSVDELHARMRFVVELPNVRQVDVLPYHRYGQGKYARLGLDYSLEELAEYNPSDLTAITELVNSYGIPTTVGG